MQGTYYLFEALAVCEGLFSGEGIISEILHFKQGWI